MSQHRLQDDITKQVALADALDFGSDGIKADVIAESTSATGVTIDGVLVKDNAVTASSGVTAAVTGNVTGNVTGDVTGNVTGNITGALTGSALNLGVDAVTSAGNNIANATAITGPQTFITAANNVVGAVLPTPTAGDVIIVHNLAANGALIYPAVNTAINALGANNAIEMATVTSTVFSAFNSTLWYTCPRVPS